MHIDVTRPRPNGSIARTQQPGLFQGHHYSPQLKTSVATTNYPALPVRIASISETYRSTVLFSQPCSHSREHDTVRKDWPAISLIASKPINIIPYLYLIRVEINLATFPRFQVQSDASYYSFYTYYLSRTFSTPIRIHHIHIYVSLPIPHSFFPFTALSASRSTSPKGRRTCTVYETQACGKRPLSAAKHVAGLAGLGAL
jgi:hypothetical protein